MARDKLGSLIASYNYRYKNSRKNPYHDDLLTIINRLKNYGEYRKLRSRDFKKVEANKQKKLKKAIYKKIYNYKPLYNPYVAMWNRGIITQVDPNLLKKYNQVNIYTLGEFSSMLLPNANYALTAGQAWYGLKRAWKGYKTAKGNGNDELEKKYAGATQKWNYLLDTPIPDFPDIDLFSLGYKFTEFIENNLD